MGDRGVLSICSYEVIIACGVGAIDVLGRVYEEEGLTESFRYVGVAVCAVVLLLHAMYGRERAVPTSSPLGTQRQQHRAVDVNPRLLGGLALLCALRSSLLLTSHCAGRKISPVFSLAFYTVFFSDLDWTKFAAISIATIAGFSEGAQTMYCGVFAMTAAVLLSASAAMVSWYGVNGGSDAPYVVAGGYLVWIGWFAPKMGVLLCGSRCFALFYVVKVLGEEENCFLSAAFLSYAGCTVVFDAEPSEIKMVCVAVVFTVFLAVVLLQRRPPLPSNTARFAMKAVLFITIMLSISGWVIPTEPSPTKIPLPLPVLESVAPKIKKMARPRVFPEEAPEGKLQNATLVIMDSQRKPLARSLRLLTKHFLGCWPYPINVFTENMEKGYRKGLMGMTSSQMYFHDVRHIFTPGFESNGTTPITPETLTFWIESKRYSRGHHLGYRQMCRFFAGVFAQFAFLAEYEYYWRLDTDSFLKSPLQIDPFVHMKETGCVYGHMGSHRAHRDAKEVTLRLFDTVLEWAEERRVPAMNLSRLRRQVCDKRGDYMRAMYYNNFEIVSTEWVTGEVYQDFFRYLDYGDGFMKNRWGDAPVRTLAVWMMLSEAEVCDYERLLPYKHGYYTNKVYQSIEGKTAKCPAKQMEKSLGGRYLWPARYRK